MLVGYADGDTIKRSRVVKLWAKPRVEGLPNMIGEMRKSNFGDENTPEFETTGVRASEKRKKALASVASLWFGFHLL